MRVVFILPMREVPTERSKNCLQWARLEIEKDLPFLPPKGMSVWFPSNWGGEGGDPLEFVIDDVCYDAITECVECTGEKDEYEADEYPGMYAERVATMLSQGWKKRG